MDLRRHHVLALRISGNRGWPNVILRIAGRDTNLMMQLDPVAVAELRAVFDDFLARHGERAVSAREAN